MAVIKVENSTSDKDINEFTNNAIEKDITKLQVENDVPITTEDFFSFSTTSLPDIPKDSILSKVIIPTENLSIFPLQCSSCNWKLLSYFALSTFNDTTIKGSVNTTFVTIANKLRIYQEVIHSPHLK